MMEIIAKLPNHLYVSMDLAAEDSDEGAFVVFFRKSDDGRIVIESTEFSSKSEDTENLVRSIFAKRVN